MSVALFVLAGLCVVLGTAAHLRLWDKEHGGTALMCVAYLGFYMAAPVCVVAGMLMLYGMPHSR